MLCKADSVYFGCYFSEFCNTYFGVFRSYCSRKNSTCLCFFPEILLYLLVEMEVPVFFSS